MQRLSGNRAVASLLGSPVTQRLSFERSLSGTIGGFFGRADVDAERWVKQFVELKKIASLPLPTGPSVEKLQKFVGENKNRKVSSGDRDRVGKEIGERLSEAQSLLVDNFAATMKKLRDQGFTLKDRLRQVLALAPDVTVDVLLAEVEVATPEERKEAADDRALVQLAKSKLRRDVYLALLPSLGQFLAPSKTFKGAQGKWARQMTGPEADKIIRDQLGDLVKEAVSKGKKVEGEVSVVDKEDFLLAFERQWGPTVSSKGVNAFVDVSLAKRHIWIHRNRGNPGTVVHEGMHKYAEDTIRKEQLSIRPGEPISQLGGCRKILATHSTTPRCWVMVGLRTQPLVGAC